jgi:hypothetical protein
MAKKQTPATGSLYSRLGINSSATDEQVRTAYYKLAKDFHPDRRTDSGMDEEDFNSIVRAAAILRDPAKRKLYDRGAIDEHGARAGSRGRRVRWSSREGVLACFIAALTVLVSVVAFYTLDKSGRDFPAGSAHTGGKEKGRAAAPVPDWAPRARTEPQQKQQALAPRSDDSSAEPIKALQSQPAVYSPPAAEIARNRAEPISIPMAAVTDGRNQAAQKKTSVSRKSAAAKQVSNIRPGSGNTILSAYPKGTPQVQNDCYLTSAARNILAGIISR